MKRVAKSLFAVFLTSLFLVLAGCNGSGSSGSGTVSSITITPANVVIAAGAQHQFTATATYSSGGTQNVSSSVTWATSDATVATISLSGLLTSLKAGTVTITATLSGVHAQVTATISDAQVQSIAITPAAPTLATGSTQQFTATATLTDGTMQDISGTVTWASSNTSVATIDSTGMVTCVAAGTTTISATSGSISNSVTLTVSAPALMAIAVSPSNPTVAHSTSLQFQAIGFMTDGSSQDLTSQVNWTSFSAATATINASGLTSAVSPGSSTIQAAFNGKTSSTTLTVSNASLTSIAVQPSNPQIAKDTDQQFSAIGMFSDGTQQDLTNSVTWTSGATSVATVTNAGRATGVGSGASTITATSGSTSSSTTLSVSSATLTSIIVSPTSASIPSHMTLQFRATGNFSDDSQQDLTDQVVWSSSDTSVATVDNTGLATGVSQGDVSITASKGGVSSQIVRRGLTRQNSIQKSTAVQAPSAAQSGGNLLVTPATLASISISPSSLSIAANTRMQLHATGIFSDGSTADITDDVAWTSSSTSAEMTKSGMLVAYHAGDLTVQAMYGSKTASVSATITNATLTSLAISPTDATLAPNTSQQYSAVGTFSDNSTQDLTLTVLWSTDSTKASISAIGLLKANAPGALHVQATSQGITATTPVVISGVTIVSISITPSNPTLAAGTSVQFNTIATLSDGTTQDVSSTVVWGSSSPSVSISNSGLATANSGPSSGNSQSVIITATQAGSSRQITLTLTSAALSSLAISPDSATIGINSTQQFTATGTFTDGSTQNLSSSVIWTSSTGFASISNSGLATGVSSGSAVIQAAKSGITATADLTVSPATIISIAISPANVSFAAGTKQQFTATATLSDGSTQIVTNSVVWSSTNPAVATISATGLATGKSTGSATIQAARGSVSGSVSFTVSPATLVSISFSPENPTVAAGQTLQITATATFSDGSTQDVTNSVTWTTSDGEIADVSTSGVLSGNGPGTATITASLNGVTSNFNVAVSNAQISSLTISPGNPSAPLGDTQQLVATANYSDGTSQNVSSTATWTTSNSSIASVNSSGLVGAQSLGTATIQATYGSAVQSVTFTSTSAVVTSVSFTPSSANVAAGLTRQLSATAAYSDGSSSNVTASATWTTSNSAVATVNSSGLVSAKTAGSAVITGTYGAYSNTVNLTVTPAQATSISLAPQDPSLAAGQTQQMTATANFTDGTSSNVSSSATWATSNSAVAVVSTGGLITSKSAGSAVITATYSSVSSTVNLTVNPAAAVSISVSPQSASLAAGQTQQISATATYTDGSTQNVTNTATWTTSNSSVATVSTSGLITAKASGSATITVTVGSASTPITLTVGPATVVSIAFSPSAPTLAAGQTVQITATATYTDNTTQDVSGTATWATSNAAIATVSSAGLITAKSAGAATITATSGGVSSPLNINVGPAVITSIAVTPTSPTLAAGLKQQFTAIATFTDATTQDVSSTATWISSNLVVATINSTGMATTHTQGSANIQASLSSVNSNQVTLQVTAPTLVSISVTVANTQSTTIADIAAGFNQQFVATGTFTDGSTQDLSSTVTWSSTTPLVATVDANGLATALTVGTSGITATLGSVSGSGTISVTPATLSSITLTPVNPTLAAGVMLPFIATGTFSDGTTHNIAASVTWSSSNTNVITIDANGIATAVSAGNATITATSGSVTANVSVTVGSAVLVSIQVTPANPTIALGTSQQFVATGIYSDGSTQNLSLVAAWDSSNPSVALVGPAGLALSVSVGTTSITATIGEVQSSSTLTVNTAQLVSITVGPPLPVFAKGTTQQFTAVGTFTDGSTQNLTSTVSWTSSNFDVVTINASGLASGVGVGTATVTATSGSVSSQASVTITSATLLSIAVTPVVKSIPLGLTQQFTATATYSDGSTQDITSTATWSSSLAGVAVVNSSGLATSAGVGITTISASSGIVSGTSALTVTAAVLSSITVSPASPTCAAGFSRQLAATGHYTDSSTQDLTASASWSSSSPSFATVNAFGLASCLVVGTPTITATYNSISGSQNLTVTNAVLQSITVTAHSPSISLGLYDQMTAIGHYSDGSTLDITNSVNWTVSNALLAIIDSHGNLLAVSIGNVTVTATSGSVTNSVLVHVIL